MRLSSPGTGASDGLHRWPCHRCAIPSRLHGSGRRGVAPCGFCTASRSRPASACTLCAACRLGDCLALRAPDAIRVEALRQSRLPPVALLIVPQNRRISALQSELVALVLRYADGAGCFPVENRNAPPLGCGARQTPRRNCARRSHAPAVRARLAEHPPLPATAADCCVTPHPCRLLSRRRNRGQPHTRFPPPDSLRGRVSPFPLSCHAGCLRTRRASPYFRSSAVRLGRVKVTRSKNAYAPKHFSTESF